MFAKQTVVDRIEVLADQTVAVRYMVTITENGKFLPSKLKANTLSPVTITAPKTLKYKLFARRYTHLKLLLLIKQFNRTSSDNWKP